MAQQFYSPLQLNSTLTVGADGAGHDVKFFLNASGRYIMVDEDDNSLIFTDNANAKFGNGGDLQLSHDGTDSRIDNMVGHLKIRNYSDDSDIIFETDNGSGSTTEYLRFDGGAVITVVSKEMRFTDSVPLKLGNGPDFEMSHDGSNTVFANGTGNLKFKNNTDDGDIVFECDDGSGGTAVYLTLDGSSANGTLRYVNFPDNVATTFGDGNDLRIYHYNSEQWLDNSTGDWYFRQLANDKDIIFQCDDGSGSQTAYITLDGSQGFTTVQKAIRFEDGVQAQFGSGNDSLVTHSGSNMSIVNSTGHIYFANNTNDGDIYLQCDDGSGGTTTYLTLDGSVAKTQVDRPLLFVDNISAEFGTDTDMIMYSSGSHGYIENYTGDLKFINNANDKDIIFQSDDQSGGVATYFTVDGSTGYVRFEDNRRITVGSGDDLQIKHDGTDSDISNYTGDLYIQNHTDDKDIIFKCDDGSGGNTAYITLDGSAGYTTVQKDIRFEDNVQLELGTGRDLVIYSDGSNGLISNQVGNLAITNAQDDGDIVFNCDDGSGGTTTYLTLDGGLGYTTVQKAMRFNDGVGVHFGTGSDFSISHNGTDSNIANYTGNLNITANSGDMNITNSNNDSDIIFASDDGSGGTTAYLTLDGGVGNTYAYKDIRFVDSVKAIFGTGGDVNLYHDGSNMTMINSTGSMAFYQAADDSDMVFYCDDGSGGNTAYFQLDGSHTETVFSEDIRFADSKVAKFGASSDLQIQHNASHSYIAHGGTGNLYIQQNTDDADMIFTCDDGSGGTTAYLTIDGSETRVYVHQDLRAVDGKVLSAGDSSDLAMLHTGGNSFITNSTGDLTIDSTISDKDIIFKGTDGGADITALTLDMSAAGAATFNNFVDATNFKIGGAQGSDGQVLTSTGSGVAWEDAAGGSLSGNNFATDLKIGRDAHNLIDFTTDNEITFRINDANELKLSATSLHPTTTNGLGLGTASLRWSDLFLASGAVVNFNNGDVTMTHSSNVITIDGGDLTLTEHINLADAKNIDFGNDTDFQIQHSGSHGIIKNHTGDLKIINYADDGDLLFYTDDDSGGITEYFRCDGGTKTIEIAQTTNFLTDKALRFGTSSTFIEGATSGSKLMLNGQTDIFMRINGTTILQLDPNKAELAKPLDITDTTDSTDATGDTGALRCEGGGSIAKKLYVGTDLTVSGNITANGSIIGDDNTSITNISSIGADSYTADADATTTINMGASQIDCLVADTDVFQVTDSAFTFDPAVKTSIHKRHFAKTTNTDGDADGDIVYFGGTTSMTAGKLYYYKSDGTWAQTDADAASTSTGLLAVALGAASDTNGMLLRGMVTVNNIGGTEAVGDILYVALATGDVTKTVPSGSGDIVRVVGYCLDATNGQIWFNPDGAFVEIA